MPPPDSHDAEIVLARGVEPFQLRPIVSELVRMRRCVASSLFLVEHVDILPLPRRPGRTIRLLLGDGERCIQALLQAELHGLVDRGTVKVGCYVRLGTFSFHQRDIAEKDGGQRGSRRARDGKMVFLVVRELAVVGWHTRLVEGAQRVVDTAGNGNNTEQKQSLRIEKGSKEEDSIGESRVSSVSSGPQELQERSPTPIAAVPREDVGTTAQGASSPGNLLPCENEDSDDNDFEIMAISERQTSQRCQEQAARELPAPVALPRQWKNLAHPLKLTSLKSIPTLPYKQNWSINVLAIVASLSDVEPSNLSPYTQRIARLVDPSTPKHVHLTVFLVPSDFTPQVGTPVLLVGVKNHQFDGGSLKKYASDQPPPATSKADGRWWFDEFDRMGWCDAEGLRRWWAQENHSGQEVKGS